VRLGTAEIYSAVEDIPHIRDGLIVNVEGTAGESDHLVLLVDVGEETVLDDDDLISTIRTALRTELSPRHVPDLVLAVPAVRARCPARSSRSRSSAS
jgi:acetoacetyl-CoA synthetase